MTEKLKKNYKLKHIWIPGQPDRTAIRKIISSLKPSLYPGFGMGGTTYIKFVTHSKYSDINTQEKFLHTKPVHKWLQTNDVTLQFHREVGLSSTTHSHSITQVVVPSWHVMAHGDAREGKWKGNWWMDWVASNLHTTSEHGVSSITTADAHTSAEPTPPPI